MILFRLEVGYKYTFNTVQIVTTQIIQCCIDDARIRDAMPDVTCAASWCRGAQIKMLMSRDFADRCGLKKCRAGHQIQRAPGNTLSSWWLSTHRSDALSYIQILSKCYRYGVILFDAVQISRIDCLSCFRLKLLKTKHCVILLLCKQLYLSRNIIM